MPDGISNVDPQLFKLAQQYHDCNVRSSAINDERAMIRENVDKLGIDPSAFQVGVRMARAMTSGERGDFTSSLDRVLGVLDGKEADLFGADFIKEKEERIKKRADKAAKAAGARSTDDNPRSDPKSGGAGGAKGKGKAKDAPDKPVEPAVTKRRGRPSRAELSAAAAAAPGATQADTEQAEGDALLNGHLDTMKAGAQAGDNDGDNPPPDADLTDAEREALTSA